MREKFFLGQDGFEMFEDAENFIKFLQKEFPEKVCIVTSNYRKYVDSFLKQNDLEVPSFAREDVRFLKPHLEPYGKSLELLRVRDPKRLLVLEDSLPGALSAVALGVKTVLYRAEVLPKELLHCSQVVQLKTFDDIKFV